MTAIASARVLHWLTCTCGTDQRIDEALTWWLASSGDVAERDRRIGQLWCALGSTRFARGLDTTFGEALRELCRVEGIDLAALPPTELIPTLLHEVAR